MTEHAFKPPQPSLRQFVPSAARRDAAREEDKDDAGGTKAYQDEAVDGAVAAVGKSITVDTGGIVSKNFWSAPNRLGGQRVLDSVPRGGAIRTPTAPTAAAFGR
jgi:hypothetical protein